MPRVSKKKPTQKSAVDFEPILYDEPKVVTISPKRARTDEMAERTGRKPLWRRGVFLSQAFLLCIMTGIAGYFYYQYQQTPEIAAKREIASLVKKVGSMIELPGGEEPTLATVTNKDRLDDQPFFRRAQNGDKILIYQASGRAFLYRPSTEKIIDVTIVNIAKEPAPAPIQNESAGSDQTKSEPESVATEPVSQDEGDDENQPTGLDALSGVRVALYNGSTKVGVTTAVETSLRSQLPDIDISLKEKAAKNDYVGYTVVPLGDDTTKKMAETLANVLGGTVADLPDGETAPADSDLLVIVGSGT